MTDFNARPQHRMPEAEAEAVRAHYLSARVILEYGSGASTLIAAEMPDKRITSVESDGRLLAEIRNWFAQNPPASLPHLHLAMIGPTRRWGYPANDDGFRRWPSYVQSVWGLPDFAAPDAVLIDGRFRLACLLTVALRCVQPVVVLVDDYADRPAYHAAEPMLGAPQMIGRMARFALVPGLVSMAHLSLIIDSHLMPE